MPPRDLLHRHARTAQRVRRLEVNPLPGDPGHFGRQSGWMRMTPVAPAEYVDEDQPARRSITADVVTVVCPGLVVPEVPSRIFELGVSARPANTRYVRASPGLLEVRSTGAIILRDVAPGTIAFTARWPLG